MFSEQKLRLGMVVKENMSFFEKTLPGRELDQLGAHFAKLKRIIVASRFPVKEYYLLWEEVQCSISLPFKCPVSTLRKTIAMANPRFSSAIPQRG